MILQQFIGQHYKGFTILAQNNQSKQMQQEQQRDYIQKDPKSLINKKNAFSQYSFFSQLYLNVILNKLRTPTPVQKKTIPLILEGKDVIACYKTGSGKTLAYLLPLINKLQAHTQIIGARAIILIPTRDLADQITKVLRSFLHNIDLRYSLILGGHDYEGQFESLSINPDIIIGTPGRLVQLLNQTDFSLSRVQTIIFDEADQLLGQGKFQKQVKEIISKCNPSSQRLMFSATITEDIRLFANAGMRQYSFIQQEISLPENMKIDFWIMRPDQKISALMYCLDKVVKRQQKVIVFVSTRFHVDYVLSVIEQAMAKGMKGACFGVYGKMDMDQRTNNLDNFRKRKGKSILVVTDVAARGLDIPAVKWVVHYDYPSNHQIFVHRSGRTARAEESGSTLGFITFPQLPYLVELGTFVTKNLSLNPLEKDCINYGTIPSDLLMEFRNYVNELKQRNQDIDGFEKISIKAFQKFKKCRSQASQYSVKKAKLLALDTHHQFKDCIEQEEAQFLNKLKNFNPKKSFLQLQRISMEKEPQNDNFLSAIEKIRKEQTVKINELKKRQKLREKSSNKWKQILTKNEIKQYQNYRQRINEQFEKKQRAKGLPINSIDGIEIQLDDNNKNVKKSLKKDFKNPSQYISAEKDYTIKSQFDSLPKIKTNEMQDVMIEDQNPMKNRKKRVWDKTKKNYVFQKDQQDKYSKQEKGKKAYEQWKKKSKLHIPKAGDVQDEGKINKAKENWTKRRKFRHGWRETKDTVGGNASSGQVRDRGRGGPRNMKLKNNKTKAFEKKYKSKLIEKASKGKGGRGGSSFRGGSKGRGGGFKGKR